MCGCRPLAGRTVHWKKRRKKNMGVLYGQWQDDASAMFEFSSTRVRGHVEVVREEREARVQGDKKHNHQGERERA